MRILELGRQDCLRVLSSAMRARLACCHEGQPYVVPVSLAYDAASGYLYGFTTPGQKVEWMRANPLVCVEVDEFSAFDRWLSVVVLGRYEELADAAEPRLTARAPRQREDAKPDGEAGHGPRAEEHRGDARVPAWRVLQAHPMWWEPASTAWTARSHGHGKLFVPVYYRISIDQLSGHEATPEARDALLQP